ncbi:fumarylacetoacetate hydrolase family protein [Sphingobium lactosutens]|uniref:Fumarylacetoacetase-like C-terminal domain-containing protein n=1 Tax=Sphingobium lactosutens DS20 TaxID=1331060 RepID=T0HV33_9SPHN|nr:fumarylacetoacetate hydrolase family protein [Sphingobium lactosutens]EQB16997.1 hypothetical protein RLDS_06070 [Sphingobium lactosutens DS20]
MKIVVFGEDERIGLLEDNEVIDVSSAGFATLLDLIEAGADGLAKIASAADHARSQSNLVHPLADIKLAAPWPGRQMVMAGQNNPDHVAAAFTNLGGKPTTRDEVYASGRQRPPTAFWAAARPVMGPNADIQMPTRALGYFDYEGELGVIIGKQGKDIKAADAKDYVWGVTLIQDWSIREAKWPVAASPTFMPAKNFDCSKSIGPAVVVGELDPDDVHIRTLVNGDVRQDYSTSGMTYSFGELLEYFSRDFTFHPGDVISLGTGLGTAIDQTRPGPDGGWPLDLFLKEGDVVEVTSDDIGSLVGTIVPKKPPE